MTRKNIITFILIPIAFGVFFILNLTGCGKTDSNDAEILARVGDDTITLEDFEKRVANLPDRYQQVVNNRKMEFLNEIISDTLLYQEALRQGLDKDQEVIEVINEAKKKILIARLLKDKIDDTIEITDEDIENEYKDNPGMYMYPELMRVSHILLQSRELAEEIKKHIDEGGNFEDIARAKSVDPTAQNGGDIGYFPRGQLMPEFENACINLEIGEVTGPVKTKLGYHIIKLTDRRPPSLRPLDEVKERIKSSLYRKKRREKFNIMLDNLKNGTEIVINEKNLGEEPALNKTDEEEKGESE